MNPAVTHGRDTPHKERARLHKAGSLADRRTGIRTFFPLPDTGIAPPARVPGAPISWAYNDGGREAAGFKGKTRDCVTRAIAIATQRPYREVYEALYAAQRELAKGSSRAARAAARDPSPRTGVRREAYQALLETWGWEWVPTMAIGAGCTVHLHPAELPAGRIIVRLSRHLTAVLDGVIHDTHDPSRGGARCVYGYFRQRAS